MNNNDEFDIEYDDDRPTVPTWEAIENGVFSDIDEMRSSVKTLLENVRERQPDIPGDSYCICDAYLERVVNGLEDLLTIEPRPIRTGLCVAPMTRMEQIADALAGR